MTIVLPKAPVKAEFKSPRKLLIYSPPKCGKTTAVSFLDNYLILDIEQGASFIDCVKVNITNLDDLDNVLAQIQKENKPYKYGVVDTTTKLEEMLLPFAAQLYRKTPMGKNWGLLPNGKPDNTANILALPNGGGYLYLREAYQRVSNAIDSCFERVIYLAHLRDKVLEKNGKEVSARDIDLTGKIRNIVCANSDAIGYMYREKNKTIISFKTTQDVICGARPKHIREQEIVLLESNGDKFTHHWDKIYID